VYQQRSPFKYGIKDVAGLLWSDESDNSAAASPAPQQALQQQHLTSTPNKGSSADVIQFPCSLSPYKRATWSNSGTPQKVSLASEACTKDQ